MSKDKIEVNMNVYDIPILVEALEEANKEIERLNKELEEKEAILGGIQQLEAEIERLEKEKDRLGSLFYERNEENIKLHHIIKEVREYIETHLDNTFKTEFDYITTNPQKLLEILDKVEENK